MSKLLEEASKVVGGASPLSKLGFNEYIQATAARGDGSNQKEVNQLYEQFYNMHDYEGMYRTLEIIFKKHKNTAVKAEMAKIQKIIQLRKTLLIGQAL